MSIDLSTLLNEKQFDGASCTSQYTRVIAGAGSGKTRVLTYRITHLVENMYVYPSQIMAVTFTNKAAKEIKERVTKQLGDPRGLFLGTIHSWCARFLRHEYKFINFPSSFTILDDEDQLSIMKEVLCERHGLSKRDPNIKQCLSWIGEKKTKGYQYEDLKDTRFPNPLLNEYLKYWGEYQEILFERKSLDFDDLLLKTIQILRDKENGVWEAYSKRYSHILVDEFQDINDVQFELISLLMNEDTCLYVVGDPDQTIYTWRGANNEIIMNLNKKIQTNLEGSLGHFIPEVKVNTIILDRNYRSTKKILNAANLLIKKNFERVEKDLYSLADEGDDISFLNARTNTEEAQWVASTINDLHKKEKVEYRNIAVLYRANYLTREIETNLNYFGIHYKIFGGIKFYQRKEIKDLVCFFRLVINDADDTAFDRVINVPKRGVGDKSYERIKQAARAANRTVFIYLKNNYKTCGILSKRQIDLFEVFFDAIDELRNKLEEEHVQYVDVLKAFVEKIGYYKFLEETEIDPEEREDNIDELLTSVENFMLDNEDATFDDFVANAILQSAQDEIQDGDYVSLMTVHAAKGLEFDYVFVYGLGEGVFPSKRSVMESKKGIEEERRLAYVALTRAKKKLYLSCNNEFSYVTNEPLRPSRFLEESGIKVKKNESMFISSGNSYSYGDVNKNSFSSNNYSRNSYTQSYSPRNQQSSTPINKIVPKTGTNDVKTWKVGDRVQHEKFGQGTVSEVLGKIINIQFDNPEYGKKAMLGSHISLKKI